MQKKCQIKTTLECSCMPLETHFILMDLRAGTSEKKIHLHQNIIPI
jgi:hypothetical protein